ncbi:hypothetical protein EOM57_00975 [Candidatus Saccharibacteria bacterium]|nr:hypothetical protein [Candidatus Saccharibacteria bacterium]
MARRKLDTSNISTIRLSIVTKGYLDKSDVMAFVPCGKDKARDIFNRIRDDVKGKGLENCREVILAKRMLDYMGLSTESIEKAAKLESRGS